MIKGHLETEFSMLAYYFERLESHTPREMPEANPRAKKPIFAGSETSLYITIDKARAITSHRIDNPRKAFVDFIKFSP
jgi:hypothetical protein